MHKTLLNRGPAAPLPVTMLGRGPATLLPLPLPLPDPDPVTLGEAVAKVITALLAAGAE